MRKSFIYLFLLLLTVAFAACDTLQHKVAEWTGSKPKIMYTCPMPEDSVFSDKTGRCPKCGMDLVKMEPETHDHAQQDTYTCPMPEDSVFSDKPGRCPKCGMDLVKMEPETHDHAQQGAYTCPMPEDSVFSDHPGKCPKCGMDLVKVEPAANTSTGISLETLLKPANLYVVSSIPVTALQPGEEGIETEAIGRIAYDTREAGSIVTRVAGRIEKLYVKYRFQKIYKGQHILDIYSPELMTAQQNLLFLLKNDPENLNMMQAAKERLHLLGMEDKQIQQVMQSGKAVLTVPVYSKYSGHIHEVGVSGPEMKRPEGSMNNTPSQTTESLNLKEGMYLKQGQTAFTVYNPTRAWAILNVPGTKASSVALGNRVRIVPETAPDKDFRASISFIEPFYAGESKTLTARVYFDNGLLKLPIGSQVHATIFGPAAYGNWLPEEAVLSLGLERVVFLRTADGFRAKKIETGMENNKRVQVLGGLLPTDSVAGNAQYLMDSESFIKVKN